MIRWIEKHLNFCETIKGESWEFSGFILFFVDDRKVSSSALVRAYCMCVCLSVRELKPVNTCCCYGKKILRYHDTDFNQNDIT